jgi:hypothetical protein
MNEDYDDDSSELLDTQPVTNRVIHSNENEMINQAPVPDHSSRPRRMHTASRRIPDSDIRAIFECIYDATKVIPSHIKFKIVKSISNGEKLSPPQLQFEGRCSLNIFDDAPFAILTPFLCE